MKLVAHQSQHFAISETGTNRDWSVAHTPGQRYVLQPSNITFDKASGCGRRSRSLAIHKHAQPHVIDICVGIGSRSIGIVQANRQMHATTITKRFLNAVVDDLVRCSIIHVNLKHIAGGIEIDSIIRRVRGWMTFGKESVERS